MVKKSGMPNEQSTELSFLTSGLRNKLINAGIYSLFEVITTVPIKLEIIYPFPNGENYSLKEGELYLYEGKLIGAELKQGKKPYWHCTFVNQNNFRISGYYFSSARYTHSLFQLETPYQLVVTKSNSSLITIRKIAPKKSQNEGNKFILGRCELRKFMIPRYNKVKEIDNQSWQAIMRSIPPNKFVCSFQGLIPEASFLQSRIDFGQLHFPADKEIFDTCIENWLSIKVFLKMVLVSFTSHELQTSLGYPANIQRSFLTELSKSLPFELSNSQKKVIWDILQSMSIQ